MRRVHVDRDVRIARAEGGSTWFDFDTATVAEGFGTPGGVVGSTGVCGLALGGGIGHLTSQHGSDVRQHRRRRARHARRELRTRERGREPGAAVGVKGRGRQLRRRDAPRVSIAPAAIGESASSSTAGRSGTCFPRDIVADAPRDASCQAVLVLDESLEPTVVVFPCVTGSENNHPLLVTLRARPGLVEDGVRRHSFIAQQSLFGTGYGVDRHYWKGHFVRELPDELIDELVRRISALGRPPGGILFESLYGAPKGADAPSGAIGYRQAAFNISATATWRDPALDDQHVAWSRERAGAHRSSRGRERRRLRQLHAGRRADRAGTRDVRRRGLRPPPSAQAALRPEQRPAPQPEHPSRPVVDRECREHDVGRLVASEFLTADRGGFQLIPAWTYTSRGSATGPHGHHHAEGAGHFSRARACAR